MGNKVSAMAMALSVLSLVVSAVPSGDMVDSEGILVCGVVCYVLVGCVNVAGGCSF